MIKMRKRKLSSGFTLIEAIFSLVIFLILFLAISTLIVTIVKSSHDSRNRYQALILAQNRLESIKAMPNIEAGTYTYEYDVFSIEEDVAMIEDYKDRAYRIIVRVYLNEKLLETLESIKITR